jgi:hypothetical protein
MKAKVKIESEVEIKTLRVIANVRYWEDGEIDGESDTEEGEMPCKKGDVWCPLIDIETGKITTWKQGTAAKIHYKVCDGGMYELLDASGKVLLTRDGYVPDCLCPKEEGYGDYIIMDIDANGMIQDWKFDEESVEDFSPDED